MAAVAMPVTNPFGWTLVHLSPRIGTEVLGIDLAQPLPDAAIRCLDDLLVQRKELFFREQAITAAQHVAFGRRFGELEVHPFLGNDAAAPEIVHLDNEHARPPRINIWHSDVTWRECPSLGSILRAREVPDVGGDTLFADMEAAWGSLDAATQARLDGLVAGHDNANFLAGMRRRGAGEAAIEQRRREFPPVRHPVVRTHPVSGRRCLFVNRAFTRASRAWRRKSRRHCWTAPTARRWCPSTSAGSAGAPIRSRSGTTAPRSTMRWPTTGRRRGAWSASPSSATGRADVATAQAHAAGHGTAGSLGGP
jgi:taurine dioxygenase